MRFRSRSVLLALVLLLSVAPAPATADDPSPLVIYAGNSQAVVDGEPVAVDALIFGGTAPYTVAWTFDGDNARFVDPSSQATVLDSQGLAGPVELTVTVTDAHGTVATDTVRHYVAPGLHTTGHVGPSVPDELFGSGFVDRQTRDHPFEVAEGTEALQAVLTWEGLIDPAYQSDLDLDLLRPDGTSATGAQGKTGGEPERARTGQPTPGTWTARVEGFLTADVSYTLQVLAAEPPELPRLRSYGDYRFGHQDVQRLYGNVKAGSNLTLAWDLDGDGLHESPGLNGTASLPAGTHAVSVHAVDEAGYEHRYETTVTVLDDVPTVKNLGCVPNPARHEATMEHSHGLGTCWFHAGHHTYVLDEPHTLLGAQGRVFSVEQQFSPPTEVGPGLLDTPIHAQTSLDGQNWTEVGPLSYGLLSGTRQGITFTLPASDEPFRFLRIHQPRSSGQGLSGFLDASRLFLDLAPAETAAPARLGAGAHALSCHDGDLLEDFFAAHPCWFGGLNRYDAPSFLHTYPLGAAATVDHVAVEAHVAPWRSDDFFLPLLPPVDQVTETRVHLQGSVDGVTWTTLGSAAVPFGQPVPFEVSLDQPTPAAFLRLITDHHPRSHDYRGAAPLHHPEAYFLESALSVHVASGP